MTVSSGGGTSRASAGTLLLHDDFNDGWGNFTPMEADGARYLLADQYDGDTLAFEGQSVFLYETDENWNDYENSLIYAAVNLTDTANVIVSFDYAFEDIEWNEALYLDVDDDGNIGNGISHESWKTVKGRDDNGDYSTSPGDYQHVEFDLSEAPKGDSVLIIIRAQFRYLYLNNNFDLQDLFAIDNVTIRVNYMPNIETNTLSVDPSSIYTLTDDTASIGVQFKDPDDHIPGTFSVTADIRLSDDTTQTRYLENTTSMDPRLSVERIGPGIFNLTIFFDPEDEYGFGPVDLFLHVYDEDGMAGKAGYNAISDIIDLVNYVPVINSSAIHVDRTVINLQRPVPQTVGGQWVDLDNQSVEDYELSLKIRGSDNVTLTLADNVSHGQGGVTVQNEGDGRYRFQYEWLPNASLESSSYDLLAEVRDGNGGSSNTSFNENPHEFELINATIGDVEVIPSGYNRREGAPIMINFTVTQSTSENVDLRDAEVRMTLRSSNGTEYPIFPETRRDDALLVVNLSQGQFKVSFLYTGIGELPDDVFDVIVALLVDGIGIYVSGYDDNAGLLTIYNNTPPTATSLKAESSLLNTYYSPTVTLSASFTDEDDLPFDTFSFNLSLRSPSDATIYLHSGKEDDLADLEVNRVGYGEYVAEFSFVADEGYEVGGYDVSLSVFDRFDEGAHLPFSANIDVFELYFNVPPSPPHTVLPDETRERAPLIHWYGAADTVTKPYELEYYIRIGTSVGMGDVSDWQSVGKNPFYQVGEMLAYETYYVEVMTTDGMDNSTAASEIMDVFVLANLPPTPPNSILPDFTVETLPRITWSGAADDDEDVIKENYIQIGTYPYGNDTLPWTAAGASEHYQIQNALEFGTYYVQVKVSDGKAYSYVHQELLHIVGEGNAPPSPPTEMYPTTTWDSTPNITWVGAYDIDGDDLSYSLRIGTTSGSGDIIPWLDGISEEHYQLETELPIGKYHVQIKAFDGELYSIVFESVLEMTEVGNIPPLPVSNITPARTTNSTPLITWSPASDPDGDDRFITYSIQIGLSRGRGEVLSWYSTRNLTRYAVSKELAPNRLYYIQVQAFDGEGHSPVEYSTLEIIVYITEISFEDEGQMTVERGKDYTFGLRVINRGTIPNRVTVDLNIPPELTAYLNLSSGSAVVQPEGSHVFIIRISIPGKSGILGEFELSAECISEDPSFRSKTAQTLGILVVKAEEPEATFLEDMMKENKVLILSSLAVVALSIILIIILLVIRSRRNRIPRELLDRSRGLEGAPEVTYSPDVKVGVVAKSILPDANSILKKKARATALPLGGSPAREKLPAQKKRLALPQYSMVIDMNTRQVVGHTETDDQMLDGEEDGGDEGEILDFEFKDGKFEIATPGVPSAHPYGKMPTASVPSRHLYKQPAPPGMPSTGPDGKNMGGGSSPGTAAIKSPGEGGYAHKKNGARSTPGSPPLTPSSSPPPVNATPSSPAGPAPAGMPPGNVPPPPDM